MNTRPSAALALGLAVGFLACDARAQTCTEVLVGDAIVVSRATGTVYSVDPVSGKIRSLLTGQELRLGKTGSRGTGPGLSSFQTSLLSMGDRVLVHASRSSSDASLYWLDPFTGARTVALGSPNRAFHSSGEMIRLSDSEVLVAADDFDDSAADTTGISSLVRYNIHTGAITTISGRRASDGVIVGNGPIIREARGIAMLNPETIVVTEAGFNFPNVGVFLVNLDSGDRTFLSRLARTAFVRENFVDNVMVGTLTLGDLNAPTNKGGTGPVRSNQVRSIAVADGQIIVPASSSIVPGVFFGSLFSIDPATGNRTLVFGQAIVDNNPGALTATSAVIPGWASNPLNAPVGLVALDAHRVAMVNQFAVSGTPYRLMTFNAAAGSLESPPMTLSSQLALSPDFLSSGLTFFHPADLNADGLSDACQISNGLTSDRNGDGVPDETQWTCIGDYNIDGFVEFTDFDAFVQDFEAGRTTADVNRDQFLDFIDFDTFVGAFESGC